jgi:hypothetical protein
MAISQMAIMISMKKLRIRNTLIEREVLCTLVSKPG